MVEKIIKVKLRRRRLNRILEGTFGNKSVCSRQLLINILSRSQPLHSPTKAIVISSLSLVRTIGDLELLLNQICD